MPSRRALGKGTQYRSFEKLLPIPAHYHAAFAQWHRLSLMKSRETMAELKALIRDAVEPRKLEDLLTVIEYDLGYELYRAVSAAKIALSGARRDGAALPADGRRRSRRRSRRSDFEGWIAEDVGAIETALDRALAEAGLGAGAIEAVFMTGGTSHVPAVRALFDRRFGARAHPYRRRLPLGRQRPRLAGAGPRARPRRGLMQRLALPLATPRAGLHHGAKPTGALHRCRPMPTCSQTVAVCGAN